MCKNNRSVIVRAGTVSVSVIIILCEIFQYLYYLLHHFSSLKESNTSKSGAPEILVVPTVESQNVSEEVDPAATNHEISAHETVETSPIESARAVSSIGTNISHNILLGRWRLSLDLFGRVFMEDVGLEAGSVVSELGGFPVKEAKFRRDMEKLRNSQQKDITIKVTK